jgi:TonB family protein
MPFNRVNGLAGARGGPIAPGTDEARMRWDARWTTVAPVLPASPAARALICLFSLGAHAVAFLAVGGSIGPGADAARASTQDVTIDLAAPPALESADEVRAPVVAPSMPIVPPRARTAPVPARHELASVTSFPASAGSAPTGEPETADAPVVVAAAPSAEARFVLHVETGTRGSVDAAGAALGSDSAPLPEGGVSSRARLSGALSPLYPPRARDAEIEGDVVLSLVVTSAGEVADARVLIPAGFGFDESALRAARLAHFVPAIKDGRRVAVRMPWTVAFRLR